MAWGWGYPFAHLLIQQTWLSPDYRSGAAVSTRDTMVNTLQVPEPLKVYNPKEKIATDKQLTISWKTAR